MKSGSKASTLGIVIGIVCAIAGVASGIYSGIIQPMLDNGAQDRLPLQMVLASCAILACFTVYLLFLVRARLKRNRNQPSEWSSDWSSKNRQQ